MERHPVAIARGVETLDSALSTNKVLRNTYLLLSATLAFSAVVAGISYALGLPYLGPWITLIGYFALLFAVNKTADSAAGRRRFATQLEARRQGEADEEFRAVRRGWCLGGKNFRRELLEQIAEQKGAHHYGEELGESAQARARRLIEEALRKKGWTVEDLKARRKGDAFKVKLAAQVRAQTTVTREGE